jgi:hypothetical protein
MCYRLSHRHLSVYEGRIKGGDRAEWKWKQTNTKNKRGERRSMLTKLESETMGDGEGFCEVFAI